MSLTYSHNTPQRPMYKGKRIRSDALQSIVPSTCQAGVPCISVSLLVSFVVSQLPC